MRVSLPQAAAQQTAARSGACNRLGVARLLPARAPLARPLRPQRRRGAAYLRAAAAPNNRVGAAAAASESAAVRAAILRVAEPGALQVALSTELIAATVSVPLSYLSYSPLCYVLTLLLHGEAPTSELVDFFITVTGLLFGFIVSNTFYFLYSQQVELFEAIYREASALNQLLEEAELALAPADTAVVAWEARRFLTDGAWAHQEDMQPAEVLAAEINADDDALENIIRHTLGCKPAGGLDIISTTRSLRDACVARLAAAQRKIPAVQFFLCKTLGAMVMSVFPLMRVGAGQDAVTSDMEGVLFATLVGVVVLFLCLLDDLADTNGGLYSVTPVRATLQTALLAKTDAMLAAAARANGNHASG